MDKIQNIDHKKTFESLSYDELIELDKIIYQLPEFIMDYNTKRSWEIKIHNQQNCILDEYEKISQGSRLEKVKKYLLSRPELGYIEHNRVRYAYADRRPFDCSIDDFYFQYRYEIECLWVKIQRVAPVSKEKLELLVANDIEKYFDKLDE